MAHARSWRALVVEDERFARLELLELLRQHPQVEVVGEAGDLPSAVASAERLHPGVVFLDIHLGGVSGFDLLPSLESGCRVIFVTAYDAYAVRAFEVNAVDYLLKPVNPQRLADAIARLREPMSRARGGAALPYDGHLFIEDGAACGFVPVREIRCVIAAGDYSRVVVGGARQSLVRRPLSEWQARLPPDKFVRIHRSAIVNQDAVCRMDALGNGAFAVHIRDVTRPLVMSRRYATRIRRSQT